jgi:hypothetical protein
VAAVGGCDEDSGAVIEEAVRLAKVNFREHLELLALPDVI